MSPIDSKMWAKIACYAPLTLPIYLFSLGRRRTKKTVQLSTHIWHECYFDTCGELVRPLEPMCARHWIKVPVPLRTSIASHREHGRMFAFKRDVESAIKITERLNNLRTLEYTREFAQSLLARQLASLLDQSVDIPGF